MQCAQLVWKARGEKRAQHHTMSLSEQKAAWMFVLGMDQTLSQVSGCFPDRTTCSMLRPKGLKNMFTCAATNRSCSLSQTASLGCQEEDSSFRPVLWAPPITPSEAHYWYDRDTHRTRAEITFREPKCSCKLWFRNTALLRVNIDVSSANLLYRQRGSFRNLHLFPQWAPLAGYDYSPCGS